jgi:hypothetical protein
MIICVDAETKLLTEHATVSAKDIVVGDVLLSSSLKPVPIQCISECNSHHGKEKCGAIICSEHTVFSGSVCRNIMFDPYILGYVMVNHLVVGSSIVIHEDHPSIINYMEQQHIISERDGLYGVTINPDYFGENDYDDVMSLVPSQLRLCSNEYIRYLAGGIMDATGSYYRGVSTIILSDEYTHIYDLLEYILNRLNCEYMMMTQDVSFTTLSKVSMYYNTIKIPNVTSILPTKRFDYTYSENVPATKTTTDCKLLMITVDEPLVTENLMVVSTLDELPNGVVVE